MLLSDTEIRFDFGDARFSLPEDRDALGWVFSQFLYGEVTGIQVGHWIYNAPDLDRAQFLVRQCAQELSHVRLMCRILERLGVEPRPAHRLVRFLSTGLMGADWEEHVCLEMALGEGYVLTVFLALIDTVPDADVQRMLTIAAKQEATHVAFGEQQTQLAARNPRMRQRLLGMSLVSLLGMQQLARQIERRTRPGHPVWSRLPQFARHATSVTELRLQRMGLLESPLSRMSTARRLRLLAAGLTARALAPLKPARRRRITSRYLQDPQIQSVLRSAG
jgi:hypothetical protein